MDGDLYVRAYNGRRSCWHQAALRQKAGRIIATGVMKEVAFEAVDGHLNDQIDDACRTKYQDSPYLDSMISNCARSATVRVASRNP